MLPEMIAVTEIVKKFWNGIWITKYGFKGILYGWKLYFNRKRGDFFFHVYSDIYNFYVFLIGEYIDTVKYDTHFCTETFKLILFFYINNFPTKVLVEKTNKYFTKTVNIEKKIHSSTSKIQTLAVYQSWFFASFHRKIWSSNYQ